MAVVRQVEPTSMEMFDFGATPAEQVAEPEALAVRSKLSATIEEVDKKLWEVGIDNAVTKIDSVPDIKQQMTEFSTATSASLDAGRALINEFDAVYLELPFNELASLCGQSPII